MILIFMWCLVCCFATHVKADVSREGAEQRGKSDVGFGGAKVLPYPVTYHLKLDEGQDGRSFINVTHGRQKLSA